MARTAPAQNDKIEAAKPASKPRPYLKQTDVPEFSLDEALRIPAVISEQFGGHPTSPTDVALALDLLPQGRHFKQLSGAAVAYRVIDGGSQAAEMSISDLGRRIVAPLEEGDDVSARREAFLQPRVIREFLEKYNRSSLPTDERVVMNVLEAMGVPRDRTTRTFEMIAAEAEHLGLISMVKGRRVVNLRSSGVPQLRVVPERPSEEAEEPVTAEPGEDSPPTRSEVPAATAAAAAEPNRNVFITHGSNKKIVDQLKKMLEYGEFTPVVSVERETTAKPVPKKVFDDMRSCSAGIIHVAKEQTIVDQEGKTHHLLNENVLTEIGGAMALWGDNFILLVEEGTKLPSNLQGLYEVRYEGSALDADATMRLLQAFNQFKS
jgi:hypothetical protein